MRSVGAIAGGMLGRLGVPAGLPEGKRRKAIADAAHEKYGSDQPMGVPVGMVLCPGCSGRSWIGDEDDPMPCELCTIGVVPQPAHPKRRIAVPDHLRSYTFESFRGLDLDGKEEALEMAELFCADPFAFGAKVGKPGLCLAGFTGRGKTGLAAAIANSLAVTVHWIGWHEWLADLRRTFSDDDPRDTYWVLDETVACEVLVVDDLGTRHGGPSGWRGEMTQALFDKRGSRPIVVTTMLSVAELEEQLGDHVASRIWGQCQVTYVEGADLRR